MADLHGSTIATTYSSLLKFSDNGVIETDAVQVISDGRGTATSLSLSTQRATITLGSGAADDFIVDGTTLVVEGDNNRVGIGTAAPDGTLHVHTASGGSWSPGADADDLIVETNGAGGMSICSGDNYTAAIYFSDASRSGSYHGYIQSERNNDTDRMSFGTYQHAGALYISRGKVGIGAAAPEQALSIKSAMHIAAVDQIIRYSHTDTAVIAKTPITIPAYSIITRVAAVIKQESSRSTHNVCIYMNTDSSIAYNSDIGGYGTATELLGADVLTTVSTDDTGSATDISMGTDASDLKDTWINNDTVILPYNEAGDQYVYVCNGPSNTTGSTSTLGILSIIVEYFGIA
tara:strand:- start:772 stop:1812 length:1041 start_codon:yes stop_codon:yes gene_type:complete